MDRLIEPSFNEPMNDHRHPTTLVLGATGKTGRRVAERLAARGLPVRAGSRSGTPPFDWNDRATWGPALDGADAVYVSYFPDLAVPGAAETVGALAEQARAAGARRLVLLSGRGEEAAVRSEQLVQTAFPDATVVRCSWFAQNFSESFLLEPIQAGELALPVNGVAEPFVDVEDVADVAVAALTEDGHAGQLYELTGPRLITFVTAVEEIGEAAGRQLRFESIPMEAFTAAMTEAGEPAEVVDLTAYLFREVLDGRNESLADGVQRALGRRPRDFAEYARTAAATGVWS